MPASRLFIHTAHPFSPATEEPARRRIFEFGALRFGVVVAIGLVQLLAASLSAYADGRTMRPGEARSGTLLFKSVENGSFVQAPLVATDIDITVSGPTARARVTQRFYNPTGGWVEGVYVYPLPDRSAVDTLKAVVGNRVIIGKIRERRAAKKIYARARAAGKKAALVEQERPNLFTNSLANIGPGETVVVQIEYQQTVRQSDHEFSLRVPLVVAPRYNPEPLVQTVRFDNGWGRDPDPVPDRSRIAPPVLDPRTHPPVNPVTLTVRLQAGFPLGAVTSHYHTVKTEKVSADTRIIKIDGPVPADRDFELTWSAKPGKTPAAGLFHERVGKDDYLLAFVTPPSSQTPRTARAREMIFVIDTSGSMAGTSIRQAKASLTYALKRLTPRDRFNIVRFSSGMVQLFPAAVSADRSHLEQALNFVSSLRAGGGTNMVPAMSAALVDQGGAPDMLRQVVFLTDGAIGNERQLFDTIAADLGRSRIFMVGIGSAPNSYLMNRAAELGRGSVIHIGGVNEVEARMRSLFNRLEKPAVTDLRIEFSKGAADVTPKVLPDLYADETLEIAAKLATLAGTVKISGRIGDRPWTATLPLERAAEARGISKLWARARIADAEVAATLGHISKATADQRILSLALEHSLVSRLTSLVAVETTPSRPAGAPLTRADVPLNLPAGWDFDKVFGEAGRRLRGGEAAPDRRQRDARRDADEIQRIAVSRDPAPANLRGGQAPAGISLPRTGTDGPLCLRLGLPLAAVSLLLLLLIWRRERWGRN